jgi:hypothetical protein
LPVSNQIPAGARLRGETNIAASQRRNAWAGTDAADTVDAA